MRLYKFKSLADFEFVADIIMNNRLYAADFRSLNDPMEGLFHNYGSKKSIIDSIDAAKQKHLVCSLSKDCTSPLLWAHYADGFKGVCIEVEVNENILTPYIIEYTKESPVVSYDRSDKLMGEPKPDPNELAVEALTRKFPD